MNPVHEATNCAVAASAEIIGAKWTALLVHDLSEGPRRFSQLEKSCSGISPRTLAERLRALEHEGIVERRSYAESPPRVEYELTEKGASLLPIIDAMREFGHSWLPCGHDHSQLASRQVLVLRVHRGGRLDAELEVAHEEPLVRRVHVRLR